MVLYIRQENNIDWRQECVISQVRVTGTLFREKTQEGGATTKAGENGKGLFYQPCPADKADRNSLLPGKREFYFLTTVTCLRIRLWVSVKHLEIILILHIYYIFIMVSCL